jgi:hypothetical protein
MSRYTIPERLFVPNFIPALISVYYIHLSSSIFLMANPYFAFKKYTGTSKFPFRAVSIIFMDTK